MIMMQACFLWENSLILMKLNKAVTFDKYMLIPILFNFYTKNITKYKLFTRTFFLDFMLQFSCEILKKIIGEIHHPLRSDLCLIFHKFRNVLASDADLMTLMIHMIFGKFQQDIYNVSRSHQQFS